MLAENIYAELILFFTFYGVTGAVSLMAAVYLLLRRGNAFAPDVMPPLRLRRWTASFFAVSTLAHVWWILFYIYSGNPYSVDCLLVVMLDCVLLFTTFAGMLLAMLQDRRRHVWPFLVAMLPFMALMGAYMVYPSKHIELMARVYVLLLCLFFTVYMAFAIRRYGRWLNDNYADLENKKVWLIQAVALGCMLLFVLYIFATDMVLIYILHILDLVLVALLLWRVETLPTLQEQTRTQQAGSDSQGREQSIPLPAREEQGSGSEGGAFFIDLARMEQLLTEHCVAPQLYLQHDLTLQQLAQAIGTNRYYLSQYFSHQGITYNTYINNLRINHFITLYQKATVAGQSVGAQQLAQESGFRSYSTFGRAFTQRMGQSVTAWMRDTAE